MKTMLINAPDEHNPGMHYMVVDNHGLLVDLRNMRNSAVDPSSLTDPTVAQVTWGPSIRDGEMSESGTVTLVDGTRRTFFDKVLLRPYLAAFEARRRDLLGS